MHSLPRKSADGLLIACIIACTVLLINLCTHHKAELGVAHLSLIVELQVGHSFIISKSDWTSINYPSFFLILYKLSRNWI